jgi:hypothetical protein
MHYSQGNINSAPYPLYHIWENIHLATFSISVNVQILLNLAWKFLISITFKDLLISLDCANSISTRFHLYSLRILYLQDSFVFNP